MIKALIAYPKCLIHSNACSVCRLVTYLRVLATGLCNLAALDCIANYHTGKISMGLNNALFKFCWFDCSFKNCKIDQLHVSKGILMNFVIACDVTTGCLGRQLKCMGSLW